MLIKPKLTTIITLFVVFVILLSAFAGRTWFAFEHVFKDGQQVRLVGVDSFFHLRHAKYTVANYPDILREDVGASFPNPRKNEATGLLGLAISSLTYLLYGESATLNEIAAVSAWFSPIIAVFSFIVLFILLARLSNTFFAILGCVFYLLYPGKALDKTVLGFVDHHAIEIILSLAIALGLVYLLKTAESAKRFDSWKTSLLSALPIVLLIYTWQGAELFLLIIIFALFVCWSAVLFTEQNVSPITQASLRYGVIILLTPWLRASDVILLAAGAISLVFGALFYQQVVKRLSTRSSPKFVAIYGVLAVMISAFYLSRYTGIGSYLTSLVLSSSSNMIFEEKAVTMSSFITQFGVVGLLGALSILFVPTVVITRKVSIEKLVPIVIGGSWLYIWCSSGDFDYLVPAFLAINAALLLFCAWTVFKESFFVQKILGNSYSLALCISLCLILLLLPLYPLKVASVPWITTAKLEAMTIYSNAWYQAADWLKNITPLPARTPYTKSDSVDNSREDYGVLVSWDFGNIVASHGERIPVWSSLPNKFIPRLWLAQNEQEFLAILSERQTEEKLIRYVVVDDGTYGPLIHAKSKFTDRPVTAVKRGMLDVNGDEVPYITLDETHSNAMVSRLYAKDGIELSHFRLVYESAEQSYNAGYLQRVQDGKKYTYYFTPQALPIDTLNDLARYTQWQKMSVIDTGNGYLYDGNIASRIKIYEIVKGYLIKGNGLPGYEIQARISLVSKTTGRHFVYRRSEIVDELGEFAFYVPYSTDKDLPSSDVIAQGDYQLWVRAIDSGEYRLQATLKVPESSFKNSRLPIVAE